MALSNFPDGASNAASEGSQPVNHNHWGFDTAGIFDNHQPCEGWSSAKKTNIEPHDYGYDK